MDVSVNILFNYICKYSNYPFSSSLLISRMIARSPSTQRYVIATSKAFEAILAYAYSSLI